MLHQLLLAALAGASVVPYEPHEHSSIRDASFRSGLHFETISLYDIGGGGWHWLNLGEGAVTFGNTSLPHRPAAFPDWLDEGLPVRGVLVPFVDLAETKVVDGGEEGLEAEGEQGHATGDEAEKEGVEAPERACVPVFRPRNPPRTDRLALVERGGCDFATKVLAAQARGAGAVIVGDSARPHESDREGRMRENLITMFSPDTTGIYIPSVFVSRASYLLLRDLLRNSTVDGKPGLRIEIGEVADDGNALGSLLTFALLMPSLFLIATVAAHRMRVARQREANRAPPTVVLSLPERIWSPDIVWEKDDSDSDKEASIKGVKTQTAPDTSGTSVEIDPVLPGIAAGDSAVSDPSTVGEHSDSAADDEAEPPAVVVAPPRRHGKQRRQSKRYYSKDECAICMDNFQKGEIVRILPCGHVFHKDECDEWLLKWRKLCPTCRADVTLPPGDLSGSATLTPVVDRTQAGTNPLPVYGATATDTTTGRVVEGADRLGFVGTVVGSVRDSLRQLVSRGHTQQQPEQTPLIVHDV